MCRGSSHRWTGALAVAVVLVATPARAQSSLQVPLQFDFQNPGARSMSLGGAFTGLADDATAAFTNPAGLVLLAAQEVSIEVRGRRVESPYLLAGRLSGSVTNTGVDTVTGPVFKDATDINNGVSFLSWVYPHKNQWAIAAYRHELLRLSESFATQGVFQRGVFGGVPGDARELPQTGVRNIDITNYGVSGAYRAGDFSFGAGLSIYRMEMESLFQRYVTTGFYGPPDFNAPVARSEQVGDDVAIGANLGMLWTVTPKVRLGVTYRISPSFSYDMIENNGTPQPYQFRVPHVFSVGGMFRVADPLMIVADYTRVNHSRLEQDFVTSQALASGLQNQFSIDDANEVHGGVEYVFTMVKTNPTVRFGVWYDPSHSVQYHERSSPDLLDERMTVALSQGEDAVHYTVGVGVALHRRLELNAAGDFSSRNRLLSASAVVRF